MQGAQVEGRPLSEEDLKLVARLGNLLTQRPQGPRGQTMNHKVTAPFILFLAPLKEPVANDCCVNRVVLP